MTRILFGIGASFALVFLILSIWSVQQPLPV
jgi:hypothetical protein